MYYEIEEIDNLVKTQVHQNQKKIFQPIVICIAQHGLSVPLKDNPSVTKDWLERYLLLVVQVILNKSDAYFCQLNQNATADCLFDFSVWTSFVQNINAKVV